jgi:hypothetical protein
MDEKQQPGNKPFNALNIDGGNKHVVRNNRFVDLLSVDDRRASAVYFKLTTRESIIEQNLIVCRKRLTADRTRAGISSGESGMTGPYCDGDCANVNNVYRNNVIMNCDGLGNSFAIGVVYEKSATYLHNTVHVAKANFWSGDSGSDVVFKSNILYGKWLMNGTSKPTLTDNLEQGMTKIFTDGDKADFSLADGSAVRSKVMRDPKAPHDFCGHPRLATTDLGAIEYGDARAAECAAKIKTWFDGL